MYDMSDVVFWKKDLINNTEAQQYLMSRGFDVGWLMENFYVGSCREDCRYNERIMLPYVLNKKLEFLTSRTYTNKKPPHLHMSGDIEFFYNHSAIGFFDKLYLCESPIDTLSMVHAGLPAIGITGASSLPKNAFHLYGKEVTMIFDGDEAGRKGANKLGRKLLSIAKRVNIALLKENEDVNDLFRTANTIDFQKIISELPVTQLIEQSTGNIISRKTKRKYDIPIMRVVSEHIKTEIVKEGKLFKAFCPFHKDTSSKSFIIYPHTNSWFCYGSCMDGGSPVYFLHKLLGVSLKTAERYANVYKNK